MQISQACLLPLGPVYFRSGLFTSSLSLLVRPEHFFTPSYTLCCGFQMYKLSYLSHYKNIRVPHSTVGGE